MGYLGSKDGAITLMEMRLQDQVADYIKLAQGEANKGNADLMEVYGDVARFCLQQLEKVQEMKNQDDFKIHFPHIDAVYGNERR